MPEPRPVPDQAARDLIRQRLDINLLVEESLNLAYHGARAEK